MYINREHNKFPLARIYRTRSHTQKHKIHKHNKTTVYQDTESTNRALEIRYIHGLEHAPYTQTPSDTIYDDAKSKRARAILCASLYMCSSHRQ